MTFGSPLLLLALVPVAAVAVAYVLLQRRRTRYAVRFAALPMLDKVAPTRPRWRKHLTAGLVLTALAAVGLAAADPRLRLRVPYEEATVIVAIDVSGSMRAQDVEPDRLTAAKDAAHEFVDQLPETIQVGAVAFSDQAALVAPVTSDRAAVTDAIDRLTLRGGTAIGEAVLTSVDEIARLAADDEASDEAQGAGGGRDAVPARLVLLSDGHSTTGRSPAEAARAAAEAGVPVSTIAYGTPDGTVQQGSRTMGVPADQETLRTLADETGGHFYSAESGDELDRVYEDIGSSIGWRTQETSVSTALLLLGIALATAATALSLRWFSRLV